MSSRKRPSKVSGDIGIIWKIPKNFRNAAVPNIIKCNKQYRQRFDEILSAVSSEAAETGGFYLCIRANNTGRNRAVVNANKKREKTQRAEKCLDMRYFLL